MQAPAWKAVQQIFEREKIVAASGSTAEELAKEIAAALEPALPLRHAVGGIITPQ